MTDIDTDQLRVEIRGLKRHQKLYRVLKEELSKLGFWRNRPRGDPAKGLKTMKEHKRGTAS